MASYALGVLRQFLAEGEWQEHLPGERALALRIGVSRPTLHEALLILEKEGAVRRRPKAAWQILATPGQAARGPRKVIFLSPLRLEDYDAFALHQYTVLSGHLAERGHETEAIRLPSAGRDGSEGTLGDLARQNRPDAWVLYRCSPATQAWFAKSGLPVVVMGSAPEALNIRSIDVDYRAAGRHAMATLLRLGHKPDRIIYLMPEEKLLGHLEAQAGMAEALAGRESEPRVATVGGNPADICRKADSLWRGTPPTALIVLRPLQTLTLMTHLARKGVRIPEDVSLVALDDNPVLGRLVPVPSHYRKDIAHFAALLRRSIEQAMSGRGSGPRGIRVIPELDRGETLQPPPKGR
jgi:DNA-binding LacI/PurR family transcriptional regulator